MKIDCAIYNLVNLKKNQLFIIWTIRFYINEGNLFLLNNVYQHKSLFSNILIQFYWLIL